jgi:hypothetical protein
MIVEAFKDTLELGLEKPEQIVVSIRFCIATFTRAGHLRVSTTIEVRSHGDISS